MESLISDLQGASTTVQALAVSAGGLIGVFTTLAVFFLIIAVSNRLGKKSE
jgi:hypothetical protein